MKDNAMSVSLVSDADAAARPVVYKESAPDSFPSYVGLGPGFGLTHNFLPISNSSITDLHLTDAGLKFSLDGMLKATQTMPSHMDVDAKWAFGRKIKIEIKDNLQIPATPISDISFVIENGSGWSQPFFLGKILYKQFSPDNDKWISLKNVIWDECLLKFKDEHNCWLFQGIIESADVSILWTPPKDAHLVWQGRLGVVGKIKNVRCYTKGDAWIIGRPVPEIQRGK